MSYTFSSKEAREMRVLLFKKCETREEVQQWVHVFLDIELPDSIVDPLSTSNPLDMVYTCYNHLMNGSAEELSRIMFFSSRFAGKTLCQSIIEVMFLLHGRGGTVHLAAIERQSRDCQKYIAKHFNLTHLKGILAGDSKKEKIATYYTHPKEPTLTEAEYKTLPPHEQEEYEKITNSVEVIVATIQSTNGLHSLLLCVDEVDVIQNVDAFEESKNVPTPFYRDDGSLAMPLTILTSTRKFASGLVSKEIANAKNTGLLVKNWNILDITQACPAERHRPDLPKQEMYICEELLTAIPKDKYEELNPKEKERFQKSECFYGCTNNCKILPACKTYLATKQTSSSRFLKPISYVQNQLSINNVDKALAQLLCRRPSSEGLVYPKLSELRHKITPAKAYEIIFGEKHLNQNLRKKEFVNLIRDMGEWFAGIDWGYTHLFAIVMGIKIRNILFVTHLISGEQLDPGQKIEFAQPIREFDPKIWADTEDPAMIKMFKKAGFRLPIWKKGPGTVTGGISVVRYKLNPGINKDPELYLVTDIPTDTYMDQLFLYLSEHKFKLDSAGKPTTIPSDENKDIPDAFRYLVQNLFDIKGTLTVVGETQQHTPLFNSNGQRVYSQEDWMSEKISELTGNDIRLPQNTRSSMTITPISYYGQVIEEDDKDKTGGKRGIVFDFS
jgi:hypothetical protein